MWTRVIGHGKHSDMIPTTDPQDIMNGIIDKKTTVILCAKQRRRAASVNKAIVR